MVLLHKPYKPQKKILILNDKFNPYYVFTEVSFFGGYFRNEAKTLLHLDEVSKNYDLSITQKEPMFGFNRIVTYDYYMKIHFNSSQSFRFVTSMPV